MDYLLFTDYISENWRTDGIGVGLILLACLAVYCIVSRRIPKGRKGIALRTSGVLLLILVGLFSCVFLLGTLMANAPREHVQFTSKTGQKVALLSHSNYRDAATTQVSVNAPGCCSRYIAYDYQGDGDDYMGATSVDWIDDHTLVIRYSLDPSGHQVCHTQAGDITVICKSHPAPFFDNNGRKLSD
jgi:hypothetical protein